MYSNKYVNIFQEDCSRHVMLCFPQQTKQRFGTKNLCTLHGRHYAYYRFSIFLRQKNTTQMNTFTCNAVKLQERFSKKNVGNLSNKFCQETFRKFPGISEKVPTGNFSKIFPGRCGKLFHPTVRKETTKKSPGTFPKNGRIFRQNPLWKRVFSP